MTGLDMYQCLVAEAQAAKTAWQGDQGAMVDDFRKAIDGVDSGEPWCAGFVGYCIGKILEKYGVKSSLCLSESCIDMWEKNKSNQIEDPRPGLLIVWKLKGSRSGHIGIVEMMTSASTFKTIEGNTSPTPGTPEEERNGNGVFEKNRHVGDMGAFALLGFLDPFK